MISLIKNCEFMRINMDNNRNNMFKVIVFFLIIVSNLSLAQTPDYLWAVEGSGSGVNGSTNLVVDKSGNTIITGYFDSTITFGTSILTSAGSSDIFIVKYDPDGKVIWATRVGGIDYDQAYSLALDKSRKYNNYRIVFIERHFWYNYIKKFRS